MAILYYPAGNFLGSRPSANPGYEQLIIANNPDTVFYFDSGSGINAISASYISMTSSYAISASYAMNGGTGGGIVTSSFTNLIFDSSSITWSANQNVVEDKAIIRMATSSYLSISGLYNGWTGLLEVIQDNNLSAAATIYLPAGSKVANSGSGSVFLTQGTGSIDFLGLIYDGSTLFVNVGNTYN